MSDEQNWDLIEDYRFEQEAYDLDGIIRLVESEGGAMVFTFEDEEDNRHYMNRYDILEYDTSMDYMLRRIHHYLESDEANGLFISFAVSYEGKLKVLNGRPLGKRSLRIGDLQLGDQIIYGMLVRLIEDEYVFDEVVYYDGGNTKHSWAEKIQGAGELTGLMKQMIDEFNE